MLLTWPVILLLLLHAAGFLSHFSFFFRACISKIIAWERNNFKQINEPLKQVQKGTKKFSQKYYIGIMPLIWSLKPAKQIYLLYSLP